MAVNMVVSIFYVESEGFQVMTELKQSPLNEKSIISQAVMAKKEDGAIKVLDSFDTGAGTLDDTIIGGLAGAFLGILGGPIGVLLGGSYGALLGSAFDTTDAINQASMIETVANKINDGECVIVALASEEDESILDEKFQNYHTTVLRYDAAVVAQEVEEARMAEAEMARQARAEFRKEKNSEFKSKVEVRRARIKEQFEELQSEMKEEFDDLKTEFENEFGD